MFLKWAKKINRAYMSGGTSLSWLYAKFESLKETGEDRAVGGDIWKTNG